MQTCNLELSQEIRCDDSSQHFFLPLSATGFSRLGPDKKLGSTRSKVLFASQDPSVDNHAPEGLAQTKYNGSSHVLDDLDSFQEFDRVNGFLSAAGSNCAVSDSQKSYFDTEEAQDQVFSPLLLMDTSLLADSYEDLLGMSVWQQPIYLIFLPSIVSSVIFSVHALFLSLGALVYSCYIHDAWTLLSDRFLGSNG